MKVVFFDKQRETYKAYENVIQLGTSMEQIGANGRYVKTYIVFMPDRYAMLRQRDYDLERIEE